MTDVATLEPVRPWKVWVGVDAALVAAFVAALVAYVRALPPHLTLAPLDAVRFIAWRTVAFAVGVLGVNGGLLLVGTIAGRRSAADTIASLVGGVCVLLVACFTLWLVVIFSFPQY
jgi:hypothetical protein